MILLEIFSIGHTKVHIGFRLRLTQTNTGSALVYMVRIPGFHPGGPGSIPGCGIFNFLISIQNNKDLYDNKCHQMPQSLSDSL